jgi:putative addiction module killer protein
MVEIQQTAEYGPGYRVYYRQRGNTLVVLLCGGDKNTQRSDIKQAYALAKREG